MVKALVKELFCFENVVLIAIVANTVFIISYALCVGR